MKKYQKYRQRLSEAGLKTTPQRIAVLEALEAVGEHPTADLIIGYVLKKHPGISQGTVYKTLETFVENDLLRKVKTEKDKMRYDPVLDHHHHLYCAESDRIEDYHDNELDRIIQEHFSRKNIKGFRISDIRMQIMGNFED